MKRISSARSSRCSPAPGQDATQCHLPEPTVRKPELVRDELTFPLRMTGYRDLLDLAGDGTEGLTVAAVTRGYGRCRSRHEPHARLARGLVAALSPAGDVAARLLTVQRQQGYGENWV